MKPYETKQKGNWQFEITKKEKNNQSKTLVITCKFKVYIFNIPPAHISEQHYPEDQAYWTRCIPHEATWTYKDNLGKA